MPITRTGLSGGSTSLIPGPLVQEYGSVSVPSSSETVIASTTVATGKKVRIKGLFAEAATDTIFRLYIDGVKVWQGRNAWTSRNVYVYNEYEGTAGEDIELRAEHSSTTHTVTGGFYGEERDA